MMSTGSMDVYWAHALDSWKRPSKSSNDAQSIKLPGMARRNAEFSEREVHAQFLHKIKRQGEFGGKLRKKVQPMNSFNNPAEPMAGGTRRMQPTVAQHVMGSAATRTDDRRWRLQSVWRCLCPAHGDRLRTSDGAIRKMSVAD